jgi:hydrogenase maturation protein HypF
MEFEGLVGEEAPARACSFALSEPAPWIADPAPLLRQAVAGLRAGQPVPSIAARFHFAVAELALEWCRRARRTTGLARVALTGGVFQNVRLLAWTADLLRREGFEPLMHHKVPPNDGGLALGQAAIAGLGGPAG